MFHISEVKQNISNLTQLLVIRNVSVVVFVSLGLRGRVAVSELAEVFIWSPVCITQLNVQCQVPGLLQLRELNIILKNPE